MSVRYLDLCTFWSRSKSEALGYLKGRICRRLQGWKVSMLSSAGKETFGGYSSCITCIHDEIFQAALKMV